MKKFFSRFLGAILISGGVMAGAAEAVQEKPILKIGVVSDVQGYADPFDWGMVNLEKAFKMLAPKQPDVILMVGDLADAANTDVFEMYMRFSNEIFGGKQPIHFSCAGNHDYWTAEPMGVRDAKEIYRNFSKFMKQEAANPLRKVINGYDFISMSEDADFYSEKMVGELEKVIQEAVKRDNKKPIFVLTHYPPANTVCGSLKKETDPLTEMFKKYPQVISFSGHTHYPLEDERSIWQKEYTAITTSTLCYGCMNDRPFNSVNSILPFAREVLQMMYMELYSDRLVIRRYSVANNCEIKPDKPWIVPLPFDPANAPYSFERRAAERKAPEFPADAKTLLRYDFGFIFLIFDKALHDDFVQYYRVKISENGKTIFDEHYVSDFYRLKCHQQDNRMYFRLPGELLQKKNTPYRFEIFPVESFGKEGKPLILDAKIPVRYKFREKVRLFPQE